MTKSLPTGVVKKQKKIPSLREFNLIIEQILHEDKIGHLFIVDIKFDEKNANEKTVLFNESIPLFLRKKKL